MLERLKSLPLTIVLTILIWMYAESQVNSADPQRILIQNVPVWWSGPPAILDRCDVIIQPQTVSVTVNASRDLLDLVKTDSTKDHTPKVFAYLDINPDDRPSDSFRHRQLRIVVPEGITVNSPPDVEFRLVEKRVPSQAAARP